MTDAHQPDVLPRRDIGGALVETINHELRTPLTVLVGHTELLLDLGLDLPERAQHSLAAIARAGDRLVELARTFSETVELDRVSMTSDASVTSAAGSSLVGQEPGPGFRRDAGGQRRARPLSRVRPAVHPRDIALPRLI